MPYKYMDDQVAANRRYRERNKAEQKKNDILTEEFEKTMEQLKAVLGETVKIRTLKPKMENNKIE